MRFVVLYKNQTKSGSNYYKLYVEIFEGYWEEATYFGNTVPKEVTSLKLDRKGNWRVEIQKHTSRDQKTGQFKGKRVPYIYAY